MSRLYYIVPLNDLPDQGDRNADKLSNIVPVYVSLELQFQANGHRAEAFSHPIRSF